MPYVSPNEPQTFIGNHFLKIGNTRLDSNLDQMKSNQFSYN